MLLLIDNYDSFTYNLAHFLGELGAEVVVKRNDAITVDALLNDAPHAVVMSPLITRHVAEITEIVNSITFS